MRIWGTVLSFVLFAKSNDNTFSSSSLDNNNNNNLSTSTFEKTNVTMMGMGKKKTEQEEVTAEWNSMAGEWDDLASGYRNAFVKILWEQTKLDPLSLSSIVDFGCGTGLLTETLLQQCKEDVKITCLDASPEMIKLVQEKIQAREWSNQVTAHDVVLSLYDKESELSDVKRDLESKKGQVDLIAASSVMSFIPKSDLPKTMEVLGSLLKPGSGLFCHSDWPLSEDHPNGFTSETAAELYKMAGLELVSTAELDMDMGGGYSGKVFIGVARKPE